MLVRCLLPAECFQLLVGYSQHPQQMNELWGLASSMPWSAKYGHEAVLLQWAMCQHSPGIAWVGLYSVLVQKIPVWSSGNTSLKALWAGALPLFRLLPICFIFLFPRPLLTHEVDVCLGVLLPRILGTGRAAMAAAPCPAGYRDCSSSKPNH